MRLSAWSETKVWMTVLEMGQGETELESSGMVGSYVGGMYLVEVNTSQIIFTSRLAL